MKLFEIVIGVGIELEKFWNYMNVFYLKRGKYKYVYMFEIICLFIRVLYVFMCINIEKKCN